ncbi:MAG: C40 family peptidase [Solirubrobacteraceae bacterium]
MRRLPLLLLVLGCALPAAARAAAPGLGTWDRSEQRAVVRDGLLPRLFDGRFHGEQPLTGRQLSDAFLQLGFRLGVPAVVVDDERVTVEAFHRALLKQLGLGDVATAVREEAARAGLDPPFRFGSEVVARWLGLRFNHPFPYGEKLELSPSEPITRAEAAWSLAAVLRWSGWEAQAARDAFADFSLPDYTPAQRAALRIAVSKIGEPYVWGGESDSGADCSGFVWQVFGSRVGGRATADAYAQAMPRSRRVSFKRLQPADLMFFDRPVASHVAIALGGGWLINSSSQGVYLQRMDARGDRFTWGRRLL